MNRMLWTAGLMTLAAEAAFAADHKATASRVMTTFDQMDANRDGKVTFDEFKEALNRTAQDRFGRLDRDDNGSISQDELRGAAKKLSDVSPEAADRLKKFVPAFEAMDQDASGGVSRDEFSASITHAAMERFEKADRNADDVITREELEQGLALLRDRAAEGKGAAKPGARSK